MSRCLSPPRGLHCAPVDGKEVHVHDDGTWFFWDETWMEEYGTYPSQEIAESKCTDYGNQL